MKYANKKVITLLLFTILSINICRISTANSYSPNTQHPILFIHGRGGNAHNWDTLINRFLDEGWSSSLLYAYTFSNPSYSTSKENIKNAIQIKDWVDQILDQTGSEKIDIICHSMGGPSSRLYIKNYTGINKVDDHVSLAGLHHGYSNNWINSKKWYEPNMFIGEPNGSLMIYLNNGDETPGGVLNDSIGPRLGSLSRVMFNSTHIYGNISWTSIYSSADKTSTPASAILDGAYNIEVPDITHLSFLYDEYVYNLTKVAIYVEYV